MPGFAHFVRSARPADLIAHFKRHEIAAALPANPTPAHFIDVYDNIKTAPAAERLMLECERIHAMADEVGQAALLALPNWRDQLNEINGAYARAHWLFLQSQDAFRRAEDIRFADENQNSSRLWDGFCGPRRHEVSATEENLSKLKDELTRIMGHDRIHIEVFERSRQRGQLIERTAIQVTVYSEGPPVDELAFEDGGLSSRSRKPVRETAIVYEADTGTIELISPHREQRRLIAMQFARTLLGVELSGEQLPPLRLDLSPLIDEHLFPTAPSDGISKVKLTQLTLSSSDQRLTQQFSVKFTEPATLRQIVDEQYGDPNPLDGDLYPWRARIEILFEPHDGGKRGKKIIVELTNPNKCNLRGKTERERLILNKYLEAWGLRIGNAKLDLEAA